MSATSPLAEDMDRNKTDGFHGMRCGGDGKPINRRSTMNKSFRRSSKLMRSYFPYLIERMLRFPKTECVALRKWEENIYSYILADMTQ